MAKAAQLRRKGCLRKDHPRKFGEDQEVRSGKWNSRKTEMTTDKCAATIVERRHGDFAEHNRVNALLGFHFPCWCAHLFRNDVDSQHHSAEPYCSICTDIYACLSTSRL